MLAEAVVDVAGIILACATLITAAVGAITLYRQNGRQHASNAAASQSQLQELGVKLDSHTQKFIEHAEAEERNVDLIHKGLNALKEQDDVLFGMLVTVDSKVSKLKEKR